MIHSQQSSVKKALHLAMLDIVTKPSPHQLLRPFKLLQYFHLSEQRQVISTKEEGLRGLRREETPFAMSLPDPVAVTSGSDQVVFS